MGATRLVGMSWYHNRLFPAAYWQMWTDAIVKEVQVEVLEHVRMLSEKDVGR